jgi:hypothetical protein
VGCSGRYATAAEYFAFFCGSGVDCFDVEEESIVNEFLEKAAADVHAALAAANACDCGLAGWAETYLKKLNILDAAVIQGCPCSNPYDAAQKRLIAEELRRSFSMIMTGEIELCAGYTGANYPAFGAAEQSLTEWSTAAIIQNQILRDML